MVRKRDEVDRRRIRLDLDIGEVFQCRDQAIHDRTASRIADMKNPATRVSCFLSPNGFAFVVVIENHVRRAFENFVQQRRTFVGKDTRGFG